MIDLNYNKYLPPTKNPNSKLGYLTITLEGLTFFNNSRQNCIVKLHFWGSSNPIYLPLHNSQTFIIAAPLSKFKLYLIDSKGVQLQIVDNRNYKAVGTAYLNWLAYLRPIEDKQIYVEHQQNGHRNRVSNKTYYLPFYDEEITATLPLYACSNSRGKNEEKIGEVTVKWECKVYQLEQAVTSNNIVSGSNLYNIRVSEVSNRRNEKMEVDSNSVCNIQIPQEINQERTSKTIVSKPTNSLKVTSDLAPRKSNISIFQHLGNLRKVREEPQMTEKSNFSGREKKDGLNDLQLQLIRMRVQMQELVGAGKKSQTITLEVLHFQSISKTIASKDVTHIDVKCEGKDKSSLYRIFPQANQQQRAIFNSPLAIKPSSLLTFTVGAKKTKEIFKGSVPIDSIREEYNVNIVSPQQSCVIGYMRVRVQRKTQINLIPRQQPKQKPIIIPSTPLMVQEKPKREIQIIKPVEKQHDISFDQQKDSYFLFLVQEDTRDKQLRYRYDVFGMRIDQMNPQKILFESQRQVINKPLKIAIYQDSTSILEQTLVEFLKATPFTPHNLTCSLILEKRIARLNINCQLYVGNLQQINYFLQKDNQHRRMHNPQVQVQRRREVVVPEHSLPTRTEESNKNSLIKQFQEQALKKRKMKTEAIGVNQHRLTEEKMVSGQSLAMDKYQMRSQNQIQEENIYLVDLLTRFLDFMPQNVLPQANQMPKQQFLQLIASKSSLFQFELIDIILSIFQQHNNQNISVSNLLQCFKAYKSFNNIYSQQKQALIRQILQAQPKAIQRIQNNSQFGTLNQSMLWGRALSKVKDSGLKQKINKFYKISSFGSTDAALLLQDLQMKEKELRSLDISNLGMLIKDWVEEFIIRADMESILNLKERFLAFGEEDNYLNIRSVGEIIEAALGLRLSLWESLMLIQEIKSSYGCDLELEEGVIAASSLLSWIDAVRRRSALKTDKSQISESQASLDPQELALIKQINNNRNDSKEPMKNSIKNSGQRSLVGLNNDSDIADIANLLREKDAFFPLELIQQTKTKQIREDMLRQSNFIKNQFEPNQQILPIKKDYEQIPKEPFKAVPQMNEKPKYTQFYVHIKQAKLYNQQQYPQLLKAVFTIETNPQCQSHFFYLTSKHNYSQANNEVIKYILNRSSSKQEKGIKIVLKDQSGKQIVSGLLPIQEINDWLAKNLDECKRTVVLYGPNGTITGKVVINLLLHYQEKHSKQQSQINVCINSIIPSFQGERLYVSVNEGEKKEIVIGQENELSLNKAIYHCELVVSDFTQSCRAIISLEELYLKNYVQQSYPLIDTNLGTFIATLSVTLRYKGHNLNQIIEGIQQKQSQLLVSHGVQEQESQTICLITQIGAISYKETYKFTPKLHCVIWRREKNEVKQKLGLVTPQLNIHAGQIPCKQKLSQQKFSLQKQDQHSFLQFKLVQSGKVISFSEKMAIKEIRSSLNSHMIVMNSVGEVKVIFTVMFKKYQLSQQKYPLRRIMDSLCDLPIYVDKSKITNLVKQAKITHNLTVTEQSILKQVCESYSQSQQLNCLIVNSQIGEISFNVLLGMAQEEKPVLMKNFISEFIFLDYQTNKKFTGFLNRKQMIQVLQSLGQNSNKRLMEQLCEIGKYLFVKAKQISYIWMIMILAGKGQACSVQAQQKKVLMHQIDGIYQSLKIRFG